jgi:DNA replication and repair protein RecF
MGFSRLRFYNFRNLENTTVDSSAQSVFLVGENGQGKTNVLEAIYMLCYGSSFRTRREDVLVRHEEDSYALDGKYRRENQNEVEISIRSGRSGKDIRVNDTTVTDRRDLIRNVPAIVFCHDDIAFVRGGPSHQRRLFNQTQSLQDELFVDSLRRYQKILDSRNALLKEGRTDLIDVYDEQLAAAGLEIMRERTRTVAEFNKSFSPLFADISGIARVLAIDYRPSWPAEADLAGVVGLIREKKEQDLRMRTTTTGPHRDRFLFMLEDRNFVRIASTGQLRLMSLILRVAQAEHYTAKTGRRPVLLVDDVLLELDPRRREAFVERLPEFEQAFYTFLPDEQYSSYINGETKVFTVEAGSLRERGKSVRATQKISR